MSYNTEERNSVHLKLIFPDMKTPGSPVRVKEKEEMKPEAVVTEAKTESEFKCKEYAAINSELSKLHRDFQGFQTSVHQMIIKVEESVKSELRLITAQLKLIPERLERIQTTEEDVKQFKEKVAELNGTLLVNDEKFISYDRKIDENFGEIKKKQEKVNVKINDITEKEKKTSKEQEEKIDQIQIRINNTERSIQDLPIVQIMEGEKEVNRKIILLEKEIEALQKKKGYKRNVKGQEQNNEKENHSHKNMEPNNVINSDFLIIGYSNTKFIKEEIINNSKTCKKVFCATYKDIQGFCSELTIIKQPEKMLVHCGCNDIDSNKNDTLKIFSVIDETLKTLQRTFPTTKIIIST